MIGISMAKFNGCEQLCNHYDDLDLKLCEVDNGDFFYDGRGYDLPDWRCFNKKLQSSILKTGSLSLSIFGAICPFCKTKINKTAHSLQDGDEPDDDYRVAALEVCPRCCYWRWHHLSTMIYGSRGLMAVHKYSSRVSKLAEFNPALPDGCGQELAIHLRRKPSLWHTMNPVRLETLVRDIIKANFGPVEVSHVGGTNDGGIDLVWVQDQQRRWLIQVKRRENANVGEGVATIRNLLGAMLLNGSTCGIVVSSADHFTYKAYRAVGRAREVGYVVKLVDRRKLDLLLNALMPKQPWEEAIKSVCDRFLPFFVNEATSGIQLNLFSGNHINL